MPETPINKIISIALALGLFFILLSYFIFTQFSASYRFAQSTCLTNTSSQCDYDTAINTSFVSSGQACSAAVYSIAPDANNTKNYCTAVLIAGGFRSINQGFMILLFIVGMIAMVLLLIK